MSRTWTEEQKAAIKYRGGNLLVSAAAGSGKTAVLVERIIGLITDPVHPTDIDKLLVVTFTRAAAGEMKERLAKALTDLLAEKPDDKHLQEQSVLIHHAEITTIHGFCGYVIQNYYQRTDIDPGYRIAEEGELALVRADVFSEMLEDAYAEGSEAFLSFVDAYAPGKSDADLEDIIGQVYDFSMSHPDPEGWLADCVANCDVTSDADLSAAPWMQTVLQDARLRLEGAAKRTETNIARAREEDLDAWADVLADDLTKIRAILASTSYAEMGEALRAVKMRTWPAVNARVKKERTEEQLELLAELKKERARDLLKKIREESFSASEEEIIQDLQRMKPFMAELVRLVNQFSVRFREKKQEKRIADFTDLEHMALRILVRKTDDGYFERTDAAREIAARFSEVIVDEYQDSNALQETILEAVSGEEDGRPDRFMVGDMKQSIYGFRMARPSLFLEKFNRYTPWKEKESEQPGEGSDGCRVDLSKNFRSRREVLQVVNAFFERLMIPELGGISYDSAQALHFGAAYYPENPHPSFPKAEMFLIDRENADFSAWQTRTQRMELEASAVAAKIRKMVGREQIFDRDLGSFRPCAYRDCVVLLRATSGWSDVFVKTLQDAGIPAYSVSKVGYFSAQEVVTVLDYLSIIDNPKQDIAMTAVLRSPMVGCSDSDLAKVRIAFSDLPFFEAVKQYAASTDEEQNIDAQVKEKLTEFLQQLETFRKMAPYTPVHVLIERVLEETGYGAYVAAMPAGQQREANLRMLVEKAVVYEKTSYHGVFNFIRYIERLKRYQIDYGEVNVSGEAENVVRVMSIHMSKGLEFPVVFLSGTSRNFNQMDERKTIVMHADLGIGMRLVDPIARTKKDTLLRTAIRKRLEQENKGEELRVLYVAMTRAQEKLIITGMTGDTEELETVFSAQAAQTLLRRRQGDGPVVRRQLEYEQLMRAKSYLQWLEDAIPEKEVLDVQEIRAENLARPEAEETIRVDEAVACIRQDKDITDIRDLPEQKFWTAEERRNTEAMVQFLRERDAFIYPHAASAALPAKVAVTEIGKRKVFERPEEEEIGEALFSEETVTPYIPSFATAAQNPEGDTEESGGISKAARGTAYHHFLQCLHYESLPKEEDKWEQAIREQIQDMQEKGLFSKEEAACLVPGDFATFLHTEIGAHMRKAATEGALHREQPFVLEVPAVDIDRSYPKDENILVQGIIDAYFQEAGRWILVDYKTDVVHRPDGRDLVARYGKQLDYYKRALTHISGIETAEVWIYSFDLGAQIQVFPAKTAGDGRRKNND